MFNGYGALFIIKNIIKCFWNVSVPMFKLNGYDALFIIKTLTNVASTKKKVNI